MGAGNVVSFCNVAGHGSLSGLSLSGVCLLRAVLLHH